MGKFTVDDLRAMEVWPQSRVDVARKLTSALGASIGVRVKVDAINELTGEYRIVLQGTLDVTAHRDDRHISPTSMSRAA